MVLLASEDRALFLGLISLKGTPMIASNSPPLPLKEALEAWSDEGSQWLNDADRVLAETQRLFLALEERECAVESREEALHLWESNLENRERLLLEREKLLTDGMLELETSNRESASSLLLDITHEISELRKSLVLVQAEAPSPRDLYQSDLVELDGCSPPQAHRATPNEASSDELAKKAVSSSSVLPTSVSNGTSSSHVNRKLKRRQRR